MARLLQPRSSSQLLAFPWGLSPSHAPGVPQEEQRWQHWPPPDAANVATLFKKQHEMASPGKDLVFQSPACASILVFLILAGEENATCPAHPLGSNRYTCLAGILSLHGRSAALLVGGGSGWTGE